LWSSGVNKMALSDKFLLFILILLILGLLILLYYNLPYPGTVTTKSLLVGDLHKLVNAEKTLFFILLTYIVALIWYIVSLSKIAKILVVASAITYIISHYTLLTLYDYRFEYYYPFITKLVKNGYSIIIFDWSHVALLTLLYFAIKSLTERKR